MHSYFLLMELLENGYAFPDAGWHRGTVDAAHQEVHDLELNKNVCSVKDWVWIDIEVSLDQWAEISGVGKESVLPAFLFSNDIVHDEMRRFSKEGRGGYVRTTPLKAFHKGYIFETVNTAYCLIGKGKRDSIPLELASNIFYLGHTEL